MKGGARRLSSFGLGHLLGAGLVLFLGLPLITLLLSASLEELRAGLSSPLFLPALWLSLETTALSLSVVVISGLPLSFWLSSRQSRLSRIVELVVELPIVMPPAVLGVALLETFGRRGLFGPVLTALGVELPFTQSAVVLAQVVVAAPFFVQSAANAFRKVDRDLLTVARTLGASPLYTFLGVALPVARPGLVVGASLAWARALGEFGATLLFAGNMRGKTQTMPLAIFSALESDVRVAVMLSLVLSALGALLLLALRLTPGLSAPRDDLGVASHDGGAR